MAEGTFVTAITCMDGRVQRPVMDWMQQRFAADYVDTITEPGPDGLLEAEDATAMASIRRRVEISVNGHGSRVVAIVGHHDCAGFPVSRRRHLEAMNAGSAVVASWGLPVRLLTLYVNEDWQVEVHQDADGSPGTASS